MTNEEKITAKDKVYKLLCKYCATYGRTNIGWKVIAHLTDLSVNHVVWALNWLMINDKIKVIQDSNVFKEGDISLGHNPEIDRHHKVTKFYYINHEAS